MIVIQSGGPSVLCPQAYGPTPSPLHRADVEAKDRLYNAIPHNEDGDFEPQFEEVYTKAIGGRDRSSMDLFREVVQSVGPAAGTVVEAWFFQCPVCGFVLPASPVRQ